MSRYLNSKPPVWFWIVSTLALLWNLMGITAYLSTYFMTEEMVAKLEPQQQTAVLYEYPVWYTILFALAVFGGTLGCVFLLLRKTWASPLFVISFVCATIQQIYVMITIEGADKVMPIMIIVVCILLVWFSKRSMAKGWLR